MTHSLDLAVSIARRRNMRNSTKQHTRPASLSRVGRSHQQPSRDIRSLIHHRTPVDASQELAGAPIYTLRNLFSRVGLLGISTVHLQWWGAVSCIHAPYWSERVTPQETPMSRGEHEGSTTTVGCVFPVLRYRHRHEDIQDANILVQWPDLRRRARGQHHHGGLSLSGCTVSAP